MVLKCNNCGNTDDFERIETTLRRYVTRYSLNENGDVVDELDEDCQDTMSQDSDDMCSACGSTEIRKIVSFRARYKKLLE